MVHSNMRNMLLKSLNDPYQDVDLIYKKFNRNVPFINKEPQLKEYGLPNNAKELVDNESISIENKSHVILRTLYLIGFAIVVCLFIQKIGYTFFHSILMTAATYGWIALIFSELFLSNPIDAIVEKKKLSTPLRKKYENYRNDFEAFYYWNRIIKLDYWMSLSGHQFEDAVATVFRNIGYSAQVSKQGGDGGIDIILIKNGEKTAVQCKAHKSPIGPSVARDFYGTLIHNRYTRGILVSRSGFTGGVYDFVCGKPIELLNLNQLLELNTRQPSASVQ